MARTHPLELVEAMIIVGIGGFAGSNLRYFFELVVPSALLATLAVNVFGSAALGFFLYEKLYAGTISQSSQRVLATGFIASFTTYSTFVIDAIQSDPLVGLGYVFGSYASGFVAVVIGREAARWVTNTMSPATEVTD